MRALIIRNQKGQFAPGTITPHQFKKGDRGYTFWKGKKLSNVHRFRISFSRLGENNPNWKGGVQRNRHNGDIRYTIWRARVFLRDDYTCQNCKKRGVYLQAHHIQSWSKYPKLRYEIENGLTLCRDCHKKTNNYGNKK